MKKKHSRGLIARSSVLLTLVMAAALAVALSQSAFSTQPVEDTVLGSAPGNYKITAPNGVIRIPFKLFRGDILLTGGKVNGRDVRMMIDNGMLWDPLLLFGSPQIDSLDLKYDGEAEVGGSGGGDKVRSQTASGITISFPGVEFTDQTAVITPYTAGMGNLWEGTDGQVSATFFKHFVVDVNFDSMVLTLIEPKKFQYAGGGIELPMKPIEKGYWSIPGTIELTDGRRVTLDLAMDLGYNDYLQIDPRQSHKMAVPEKALEASLGFGVQGEVRGFLGRISAIEIGKYRLSDLLTGFVSSDNRSGIESEAMIGLGLLTRFNFIYDYPGHRMFFEPSRRFAEPSEYDMSGVVLRKTKNGARVITRVYPNSAAADAGLVVGDTVSTINGVLSSKYDRFELTDLFTKARNRVTLGIVRNGQEKPITLTLRRVI